MRRPSTYLTLGHLPHHAVSMCTGTPGNLQDDGPGQRHLRCNPAGTLTHTTPIHYHIVTSISRPAHISSIQNIISINFRCSYPPRHSPTRCPPPPPPSHIISPLPLTHRQPGTA